MSAVAEPPSPAFRVLAPATIVAVVRGGDYHRLAVEAGLLAAAPESPEELRRQVNFIVATPDEVVLQLQDYLAVTGATVST